MEDQVGCPLQRIAAPFLTLTCMTRLQGDRRATTSTVIVAFLFLPLVSTGYPTAKDAVMADLSEEQLPQRGEWPVDPQDNVPVSKDRIWVDGCFDFSHHGELVAMMIR
jgi:hypothetical protein